MTSLSIPELSVSESALSRKDRSRMMRVVGSCSRPEPTQRKRPKYTRSKTGCLTCRGKKIKVCLSCARFTRSSVATTHSTRSAMKRSRTACVVPMVNERYASTTFSSLSFIDRLCSVHGPKVSLLARKLLLARILNQNLLSTHLVPSILL